MPRLRACTEMRMSRARAKFAHFCGAWNDRLTSRNFTNVPFSTYGVMLPPENEPYRNWPRVFVGSGDGSSKSRELPPSSQMFFVMLDVAPPMRQSMRPVSVIRFQRRVLRNDV